MQESHLLQKLNCMTIGVADVKNLEKPEKDFLNFKVL